MGGTAGIMNPDLEADKISDRIMNEVCVDDFTCKFVGFVYRNQKIPKDEETYKVAMGFLTSAAYEKLKRRGIDIGKEYVRKRVALEMRDRSVPQKNRLSPKDVFFAP